MTPEELSRRWQELAARQRERLRQAMGMPGPHALWLWYQAYSRDRWSEEPPWPPEPP